MMITIPEWLYYGGLGCLVGVLAVLVFGWWVTEKRKPKP